MKRHTLVALSLVLLAALPTIAQDKAQSLLEARQGFKTKLVRQQRDATPFVEPPAELFSIVQYDAPLGKMSAYLSKPQVAGKRLPAIIWITGGTPPGGIGEGAWEPVSRENDQSAKAYRRAGMIMMYPAFRGAMGNPGAQEGFFGEVDDVIAAADFLSKVDHVDPRRIYLGGHSTGATLALLVAAATDRFAGIIAFGPVADPVNYGPDDIFYDQSNKDEARLRSPVNFLAAIRTPTLIVEGESGNVEALRELQRANRNPNLNFILTPGADHFDIIAPTNSLLARKIVDLAPGEQLTVDPQEVTVAWREAQRATRETEDIETLAELRRSDVDVTESQEVGYYFLSRDRAALESAAGELKKFGFNPGGIEQYEDQSGQAFYELVVTRSLSIHDLKVVFNISKNMRRIAQENGVLFDGWDVGE